MLTRSRRPDCSVPIAGSAALQEGQRRVATIRWQLLATLDSVAVVFSAMGNHPLPSVVALAAMAPSVHCSYTAASATSKYEI